MKLKLSYSSFTAVIVFLYTYLLGSLYIVGDQIVYRHVYEAVSQLNIFEAYIQYRSKLYTDELGHFVIIWIASHFLEKDLFMAFSNAVLAFFSVKIFLSWGAKPIVAMFLVVFGYYHLAFYVSAERLKFGALFFVIGMYYFNAQKVGLFRKSNYFFIISIITHLQFFIVLFFYSAKVFFTDRLSKGFRISKIKLYLVAVVLLFSIFVFLYFSQHIFSKFNSYHQDFGVEEYIRLFGFFALAFYYSRFKLEVVVIFSVLFLFVALVGGMRVNMFGYFVFLYYALKSNGGVNLGVILTSIYFFSGWLGYSTNIIYCGFNGPCGHD
jgi:hypothetical protein